MSENYTLQTCEGKNLYMLGQYVLADFGSNFATKSKNKR